MICVVWIIGFLTIIFVPNGVLAGASLVGSKVCSECHQEIYADWQESGHPLQLRTAERARAANLPLPAGYSWGEISYVIGGVKNKACYVDNKGYIITKAKNGAPSNTLYSLKKDAWLPYLPGEKKSFDCAFCHTTGYQPEGKQKDLPGIVGTWYEDGIGCEACHGPGSEHASTPIISMHFGELGADICAQCHQRGGLDHKPLPESGLVRHHEQIDELKLGAHKGLSCLNCHNPHRQAVKAKKNCTICHSKLYHKYKYSKHGREGLGCIDCHMTSVPKRAISRVSYSGDRRTHLFKVNTDPNANMFTTIEEGGRTSEFMKGFLTVDYVCLPCHEDRDKQWAAQHAQGFHQK